MQQQPIMLYFIFIIIKKNILFPNQLTDTYTNTILGELGGGGSTLCDPDNIPAQCVTPTTTSMSVTTTSTGARLSASGTASGSCLDAHSISTDCQWSVSYSAV